MTAVHDLDTPRDIYPVYFPTGIELSNQISDSFFRGNYFVPIVNKSNEQIIHNFNR